MFRMIEAPATILFSLFYFLFTMGFIFQFREFSAVGLSPENLLSRILLSEELQFLQFHITKSSGTLVLHASMPAVYIVGYSYFTTYIDGNHLSIGAFLAFWPSVQILLTLSLVFPIAVVALVNFWKVDNNAAHPFVKKFRPYLSPTRPLWSDVAKDINTEFRRIDKFLIRPNPVEKVVVTDNWIVLVGQWPWRFHLAHQTDVELGLAGSEHHQISTDGQAGGTQYLTISVKNARSGAQSFQFRLNALEYQNLQDKLQGTIQNFRNIRINKTVSERFVEVFREEVTNNPKASVQEELEACIGCMINTANVKLVRRCDPQSARDPCVNCYCRAMWCLDCLGKWFASRQNQQETETWLSSKCPCPTCRSKFCILDVSMITE